MASNDTASTLDSSPGHDLPKLELRGITKRFGSLVANDHIDLTVEAGEIHCLLGENGAGKSTLMNVLSGLYRAEEGEILIDGERRTFAGPGEAMSAGIGMVHQHFMLIPVFTVAENIILGNEKTTFGGRLDLDAARALVREVSARFGFDVDPDAIVGDLPVGVQQRVEIIKALSREADILVFDEPTAVLTPQETDELMTIMRQLADAGTAIVFITHKLREVRVVADRITVVRLGKVVGQAEPTATDGELASLMVGRDVQLRVAKDPAQLGDAALVVSSLTVPGAAGPVVNDVSFEVRAGEILAIAGVQGNGQTELAEALLGLHPAMTGEITLDGASLVGRDVKSVLDAGVGFVPEDRTEDGLVGEFTIAENLMLDRSHGGPFSARGSIVRSFLRSFASEKVSEFDIRTPSIDTAVGRLSGGNQQKVVLARELGRDLRLLIASQPTRGIDVGSIEFVHKRIVATRDAGTPVIVISSELDEVSALADRIAVMYRGAIVGIVSGDASREELGLLMAGGHSTDANTEGAA
ncbi:MULTISPECIES: ABC transporter ATP-binding protein [Nocardiaceae]|uniref:Simple sugar transport system ATP-binding protein n=1 Tax=Rhodococcoides corynebacterioides TaxID=53972 RepID=A0ABS2KVH0_9NOCA|nr:MULTISPECIES: ABC transporter ATP-binding protein [Rhodococcus]MBM7415943.1 simple sugar transport system ATP-binding protein [Rhodococcus corynebacterioides]MBP1118405.1 simple sugar transport system ATP-binding protein [Rhodococcus sp. PvP016]